MNKLNVITPFAFTQQDPHFIAIIDKPVTEAGIDNLTHIDGVFYAGTYKGLPVGVLGGAKTVITQQFHENITAKDLQKLAELAAKGRSWNGTLYIHPVTLDMYWKCTKADGFFMIEYVNFLAGIQSSTTVGFGWSDTRNSLFVPVGKGVIPGTDPVAVQFEVKWPKSVVTYPGVSTQGELVKIETESGASAQDPTFSVKETEFDNIDPDNSLDFEHWFKETCYPLITKNMSLSYLRDNLVRSAFAAGSNLHEQELGHINTFLEDLPEPTDQVLKIQYRQARLYINRILQRNLNLI